MTPRRLTWLWFCAWMGLAAFRGDEDAPVFVQPEGWPKPVYDFARNPTTPAGFALGRALFYEPGLSRDGSTSCASCHNPAQGFTHGDHRLSHGIAGRIGTRNSLALVNLAWNPSFHWDGGVNNLEVQAVSPITHPDEMGHSLLGAASRLSGSRAYRVRFAKAFGDSVITPQRLLKALAQFTVMLESYNAKYDKVAHHDSGAAFAAEELAGLALFRTHCAACHKEPLFTDYSFANNGIPPDTLLRDLGRFRITHAPADSFRFRVPTLRNIEFTAPYMHDGRFKSLRQVIEHYTSGPLPVSSTLDKRLGKPVVFTTEQQKQLLTFLYTLSDRGFIQDARWGYRGG